MYRWAMLSTFHFLSAAPAQEQRDLATDDHRIVTMCLSMGRIFFGHERSFRRE
jgi:hypothetical protein